jgi:prepilin-type processing-associated H-X9-DG protein
LHPSGLVFWTLGAPKALKNGRKSDAFALGTCAIPPNVRRPDGSLYDTADWPNTWSFRSNHGGGLHFAYADGSVHFINDSIDLRVYRAASTIRGGEPITPP